MCSIAVLFISACTTISLSGTYNSTEFEGKYTVRTNWICGGHPVYVKDTGQRKILLHHSTYGWRFRSNVRYGGCDGNNHIRSRYPAFLPSLVTEVWTETDGLTAVPSIKVQCLGKIYTYLLKVWKHLIFID